MPFYQRRGNIPEKRHSVFENPAGGIFYEELVSREGFSSMYSNLYHLRMPTQIKSTLDFIPFQKKKADYTHGNKHIRSFLLKSGGDFISGRKLLFFNSDVSIYKCHCSENMSYYYRNGHHDEVIFIQEGKGVIHSNFGDLVFGTGDYLVIPRGVIWKADFSLPVHMLVTESVNHIETPSKYRNRYGQLQENSPFCERDIRTPEFVTPLDIAQDTVVKVKLQDGIQDLLYGHDPLDVVGWDGYYFPWIFNIHDFEPIVGSIHQPPPVHQTFQSAGFVICSFVSRPFDFHPNAVPAPYPHSNVDSDEILFYSSGKFMSRKGISSESITLHPMGLPHGPQPGRYEASIGKLKTEECAVMIDTFKPLNLTDTAVELLDSSYPTSWMDEFNDK